MSVRTVGSGQTYSTIQAALDNLYTTIGSVGFTETHTIQVYDGTYTETATPNTGLNPTSAFRLVFEAASGNTPIVDGQSTRANGFYIDAIDYVTVNGFIFRNHTSAGCRFHTNCTYAIVINNTSYSNAFGLYVRTGSHYSSIYNNICYSNSNTGILVQGATNCNVYDNTCYSNSNGIYIYLGSTYNMVYRNRIYSNLNSGIYVYNGSHYATVYNNFSLLNVLSGIKFALSTNGNAYNNTCYNNTEACIRFENAATTMTCKNNIMFGMTDYCLYVSDDSQTGFVSDYNDLYPTGTANAGYWGSSKATLALWKTASSQDANSISANPLYQNATGVTATNYKLFKESPCINAGVDLSAVFTTDYFGTTRPQKITFDIGFFEFPVTNAKPLKQEDGVFKEMGSFDNAVINSLTLSGLSVAGLLHNSITGVVTSSLLATADVIAKNITYPCIQDITAASRVLGRITAGAGVIEELTAANLKTICGYYTSGDSPSFASITGTGLTVNGATVLNEAGADVDTRIEGDTDANLLFADASADCIGIGTNAPSTKLWIKSDDAETSFGSTWAQIALTLMNENATNNNYCFLHFRTKDSDSTAVGAGWVGVHITDHTAESVDSDLVFYNQQAGSATLKMTITNDGYILPKTGYKSADGSVGASGSFTTADSKTVTVKNGLITAIV